MLFILLINLFKPLDSSFLLRFLRTKKFSVPMTKEAIERYVLLRQSYAWAFQGLNINEPNLKELLNLG